MTTQPFTNKPEEKMEKMVEAATHILSAIQALAEAQRVVENWAEHSSLTYFKLELEQFMICDQGESGFEPYMIKTSEKVFKGKHNPVKNAKALSHKYSHYNRKGKTAKTD